MLPLWSKNSFGFDHADVFGVSFDSRSLNVGDVFLAIKGPNFDGHNFVDMALEKGAACVIIDDAKFLGKRGVVLVDSVMDFLKRIAVQRRAEFSGIVISITGSVGKTTTRNMMTYSLNANGKKAHQAIKSYNNVLGVFHTLANTPLDADFLVTEIGTDCMGEIDFLARLVNPHYSIITDIGPAHLQNFGLVKNIVYEKSDLIKHTSTLR